MVVYIITVAASILMQSCHTIVEKPLSNLAMTVNPVFEDVAKARRLKCIDVYQLKGVTHFM